MYACGYVTREVLVMPDLFSVLLGKAQSTVALLIILNILWSVFKTYRNSYQEDLDVLKLKHLIPMCLLLALLVHPNLGGNVISFLCTACLYFDVVALMPQVMMMSKG